MRSGFISSRDFRIFAGLAAAILSLLVSGIPPAGAGERPEKAGIKFPCPKNMVYIPAGEFDMGCNEVLDRSCGEDEKPYHRVYLDAYCLDRLEVSTRDYEACVKAGVCSRTVVGGECNLGNAGRKQYPINCISWDRAARYCRWKGQRLPTEAEWEKAARGTDGRIYPWGNTSPTCAYAVFPERKEEPGCGKKRAWKSGSKPKGVSPSGVMDLAGNLLEWVSDLYDPYYYQTLPRRNPRGPFSGIVHILRGGDWRHGTVHTLRSSDRNPIWGALWYSNWGFRCAADPVTK
jgi:sulfatase modifying factor 1